MRVVVERLNMGPGHGLTRSDVKAVVRIAESVLGNFPGLVVYLKSTLPDNGAFDRPVIYSNVSNRLNVLCRGQSRELAVKEVLRELVVLGTAMLVSRGHRLSAKELRNVDAQVEKILPLALAAVAEAAEKRPLRLPPNKSLERTRER